MGLSYKNRSRIIYRVMLQDKKFVLSLLIVGIFSILASPSLSNSTYSQMRTFVANLSGLQEVPPNNSTATGWAWFNQTGNSIWYKLNVIGLDKVMGAHIHNGVTGQIGEPIVTLFHSVVPTGMVNGTLVEGTLTSSDLPPVVGFVNKMERGETYVNVHTETYPIGEIRGKISVLNASTSMKGP
jgi:CHRD domain